MITRTMRQLIEENTIALVATVTPDGAPAVSPKGTTVILDERTIAFGDIRSPQTVRNIRNNPAVELNFIDVFRRQACRLKGRGEYVERGSPRFEAFLPHFARYTLVPRMRGFVVVMPLRRGHGITGGPKAEFTSCRNPDCYSRSSPV